MRILIDMDNVLVDFEAGFIKKWDEMHPDEPCPMPKNREHFYVGEKHSHDMKVKIWHVINSVGFFAGLEPLPGAVDAIKYIDSLEEVDYAFATSPGTYEHAASDKYRWVYQHFGKDHLKKLVVTRSKFLIKGDILIDDKPVIKGEDVAEWEHIIFDRS